jgi:hypothetical protein
MPSHIRAIARRDSRSSSSPFGSTRTHRRALPPRSPVGSLIHDVTSARFSSRRSVT